MWGRGGPVPVSVWRCLFLVYSCTILALQGDSQVPVQIIGTGTPIVTELLSTWSEFFRFLESETVITYRASTSQRGLAAVLDGTRDFGALDMPSDALMTLEKDAPTVIEFPILLMPLVLACNVPGLAGEAVTLSGELLLRVFAPPLGSSALSWNDPAIQALNPGLALPDAPIRVVAQEGSSSLTYHLKNALSAIAKREGLAYHGDTSAEGVWTISPSHIVTTTSTRGAVSLVTSTPYTMTYVTLKDISQSTGLVYLKYRDPDTGKATSALSQAPYDSVWYRYKGSVYHSFLAYTYAQPGLWPFYFTSNIAFLAEFQGARDVCVRLQTLVRFVSWALLNQLATKEVRSFGSALPFNLLRQTMIALRDITTCNKQPLQTESHAFIVGDSLPAMLMGQTASIFNTEHPELVVHYETLGSRSALKNKVSGVADVILTEIPDDLAVLRKALEGAKSSDQTSEKTSDKSSDKSSDWEWNEKNGVFTDKVKVIARIPLWVGPVVPVINVPGVETLSMSLPLLAGIFKGSISRWDDPFIASLNPGLKLPSAAIRIIVHGDVSGHTYAFQKALQTIDSSFIANGSSIWPFPPNIVLEKTWSADQLAEEVRTTPYSISYTDAPHAVSGMLTMVNLINKAGNLVAPTQEAVQASMELLDIEEVRSAIRDGDSVLGLSNSDHSSAWPITSVVYAITTTRIVEPYESCRSYAGSLHFLVWLITNMRTLASSASESSGLKTFTNLPGDLPAEAMLLLVKSVCVTLDLETFQTTENPLRMHIGPEVHACPIANSHLCGGPGQGACVATGDHSVGCRCEKGYRGMDCHTKLRDIVFMVTMITLSGLLVLGSAIGTAFWWFSKRASRPPVWLVSRRDFSLLTVIASGGHALVFLAEWKSTKVAVKVLPPKDTRKDGVRALCMEDILIPSDDLYASAAERKEAAKNSASLSSALISSGKMPPAPANTAILTKPQSRHVGGALSAHRERKVKAGLPPKSGTHHLSYTDLDRQGGDESSDDWSNPSPHVSIVNADNIDKHVSLQNDRAASASALQIPGRVSPTGSDSTQQASSKFPGPSSGHVLGNATSPSNAARMNAYVQRENSDISVPKRPSEAVSVTPISRTYSAGGKIEGSPLSHDNRNPQILHNSWTSDNQYKILGNASTISPGGVSGHLSSEIGRDNCQDEQSMRYEISIPGAPVNTIDLAHGNTHGKTKGDGSTATADSKAMLMPRRQAGTTPYTGLSTSEHPEKDREEKRRLLKEAKRSGMVDEVGILARLRHPNIAFLIAASSHRNHMFLLIELMDVGSLREVLKNQLIDLTPAVLIGLMEDAAAGLMYLHSHNPPVLHMDLKSPNILVNSSLVAKLTDFGLSSVQSRVVQEGTAPWTAPEVFRGEKYTKASDIYSLGIVLWEVQHPDASIPWEGLRKGEIRERVLAGDRPPLDPKTCTLGPIYARLIKQCWAHNPKERPTIRQIVRVLSELKIVADQIDSARAKDARQSLLHLDIPTSMKEEIRAGLPVTPVSCDHVTVLFVGIVGFGRFASSNTVHDISSTLGLIHDQHFDPLMYKYGATHIETVHDKYICVTNFPTPAKKGSVLKAVQLGLAMAKAARLCGQEVAVGIHTGPLVATILGASKPKLTLLGDTVILASALQESSPAGRVSISESTLQHIQNALGLHVVEGKTQVLEGKASYRTYQVLSVHDTRAPASLDISHISRSGMTTPSLMSPKSSFGDVFYSQDSSWMDDLELQDKEKRNRRKNIRTRFAYMGSGSFKSHK